MSRYKGEFERRKLRGGNLELLNHMMVVVAVEEGLLAEQIYIGQPKPQSTNFEEKNDNSHKLDMLLPHIAKMSLRQTTCALTAEIMN